MVNTVVRLFYLNRGVGFLAAPALFRAAERRRYLGFPLLTVSGGQLDLGGFLLAPAQQAIPGYRERGKDPLPPRPPDRLGDREKRAVCIPLFERQGKLAERRQLAVW